MNLQQKHPKDVVASREFIEHAKRKQWGELLTGLTRVNDVSSVQPSSIAVRIRSATTTNNNKILLIRNIRNYISSPQVAYKLIEAGRSKDILQIQGLSIDGLNNSAGLYKQLN